MRSLLESIGHDLRVAARGLLKSPGFTVPAVLTLALGIGANSAIFTVVNAVLLKPLPYEDPDSRVMIWSRWTDFEKTWVALAEVLDYRTRTRTLADVAAWASGQVNLTGDGEPIRIGAASVTSNTFQVLGAAPIPGLGRTFDERDAAADPPNVAVISFGLWQRHYGADPAIVGRSILVDGQAVDVVGVMPRGFKLPTDFGQDAAEPTELWMPFAIDPAEAADGRDHFLFAAALLKPGVTPEAVSEDLAAVTAQLTRDGHYPEAMQFSAYAISLEDEIAGAVRPAVLLLTGAVGFLLLIACANVASLLLARAETRQREMATRVALGAGRRRLLRQLASEGLILATSSATCGLVFAHVGLRALMAVDPTAVPRAEEIAIDGRVLAFTAILAIVTTVIFSLAPALQALKVNLAAALKEGGGHGTVGIRRQRLRGLLVVLEMAFAVVLVIGAALMIRSLLALQRIDLGFDPEHVLTASVNLPEASYETPEHVIGFYRRLLERVRGLPDIRHAGLVRSLPLANEIGDWGLYVEGFVETPGVHPKGDWQVVSDGASQAMGERLVRGRLFSAADTADARPVAVINETMARMYWPNRDPIGGRFKLGWNNPERPFYTVVGIVGDLRHNGVDAAVKEKFYIPSSQFHLSGADVRRAMTLVVKTSRDPLALEAPIRRLVGELDPRLPVANVRPMTDVVGTALATQRFTGWLLALFAGLALALSAVGIYGVLAYLVGQRTREIGIRLALGAGGWRILIWVLARGLAQSVAGIGAGLLIAWWLTRLMAGMLYGIQPHDTATFAGVAIALLVVALAASLVPAQRALRVDPIRALRAE